MSVIVLSALPEFSFETQNKGMRGKMGPRSLRSLCSNTDTEAAWYPGKIKTLGTQSEFRFHLSLLPAGSLAL